MIADSTGKSTILEWTNSNNTSDTDGSKRVLNVTYNNDDSHIGDNEGNANYQWVTNFIVLPNYYEYDSEKLGLDRYNLIYDELNKSNGILTNEDDAMNILKLFGRRTFEPDGNVITPHSIIYNLTKKTTYFVTNEHYGEEDYIFKLEIK